MEIRFNESVSADLFDQLKSTSDPKSIERLIQKTGEGHFKDKRNVSYDPIGNAPHPWSMEQHIFIAGYTVSATDESGATAFNFTSNVVGSFYLERRFEGDHFYWANQDPGYGAPSFTFQYKASNLTITIQVIYYTYKLNH